MRLAIWTLWFPLSVIVLLVLGLFLGGYLQAARVVSLLGPITVLLTVLVYVVGWHSRRRAPNMHWTERLTRVLTFRF